MTAATPVGWEAEVRLRSPGGDTQLHECYDVTRNPDASRTLKTRTVTPNGTLVRGLRPASWP